MPDVSGTIVAKVTAFAKDITAYLTAERLKKEKELKKAGKDPDAILVKVSFAYSSGKGSVSRTPEKQAEAVSNGRSWTCSGAHMVDKARHVKMLYGAPGKKPKTSWDLKGAFGSEEKHFVTLADLKTKWAKLMTKHDLKNYKGKDGWGAGDEFHFELDDSKVPRSDKRVQACLLHYATITRLEGKPKNKSFESGSWKTALKPHLDKVQAELDKRAAEKKREELKALRVQGAIKGSAKLLNGANKSGSSIESKWPEISPPKDVDAGKAKVKKVTGGSALVWDSLGRSVFEKLGLAETKGFDVQIKVGVSYEYVEYANLSQTFIRNLVLTGSVIYNTPIARWLSSTVVATSNISLTTSSLIPTGAIDFDVDFKTPLDKERKKVSVVITGDKVKATTR